MIPAKVQMATKAHTAKRAFKQSNKPRLSALPSEPEMVHEHASIDSLDVLEGIPGSRSGALVSLRIGRDCNCHAAVWGRSNSNCSVAASRSALVAGVQSGELAITGSRAKSERMDVSDGRLRTCEIRTSISCRTGSESIRGSGESDWSATASYPSENCFSWLLDSDLTFRTGIGFQVGFLN